LNYLTINCRDYMTNYPPRLSEVNLPIKRISAHARREKSLKEIPARTPLSDAVNKDLKQRGFKLAGSTKVYAHMQATGMVYHRLLQV
jgi:3-methyladenine DNA glycosylase Tag